MAAIKFKTGRIKTEETSQSGRFPGSWQLTDRIADNAGLIPFWREDWIRGRFAGIGCFVGLARVSRFRGVMFYSGALIKMLFVTWDEIGFEYIFPRVRVGLSWIEEWKIMQNL